jgi:hypothetical protein
MAEFPASPVSPSEFLEEFLPRAFAEAELPGPVKQASAKLGVRLEGEGGGEWTFQIQDGFLRVRAEPREETAATIVQSVEDWRGALWGGRGGAIGKLASAIFRPGDRAGPGQLGGGGGMPGAKALSQLGELDGMLRMVVAGGEGGDWQLGLKLGPGAIPEQPTATVTLTAEDAAAMERGEIDPVQAFMAGGLQVEGDVSLLMQVQAIRMQGAAAAGSGAGSGG